MQVYLTFDKNEIPYHSLLKPGTCLFKSVYILWFPPLNPDSWIVLVVHISRVEALTIGAVLGFSFIVWLGLMSVAA